MGLHWLYENGEVLERQDQDAQILLKIRIPNQRVERVRNRFPAAQVVPAPIA